MINSGVFMENWKIGSINKLMKRIDNTGTTDRQLSSGRRRTVRTDTSDGIVQFQENLPQMHKYMFELAAVTCMLNI